MLLLDALFHPGIRTLQGLEMSYCWDLKLQHCGILTQDNDTVKAAVDTKRSQYIDFPYIHKYLVAVFL